jgi:hypothetical protein
MNTQINANGKGRQINTNENDKALTEKTFGLNTDTPDIKGFLMWLSDPEVTKAFERLEQSESESEKETNK